MIVRGHDDEAEPLKKCLTSIAPHVDGMFITITQPNDKVKKVAEFFGAKTFQFEWCNDFAKARNFSFAQVPKEYDYILWADNDDIYEGMEKLHDIIRETPADGYKMFYAYDFDQYGLPIVAHQKVMVVKNDGTFIWKGRVHEDMDANRDVEIYLIKDIKRIHRTNGQRIDTSTKRNLEIAKSDVELNPNDPRTYWNLANAYWGNKEHEKAVQTFEQFLSSSESEDEKFVALTRMAMLSSEVDTPKAIEYAQRAIGKKPLWPDGYRVLGEIFYGANRLKEAEEMILSALQKKPPVLEIIAYNPRDYDYNPMMLLAKIYWDIAKPKESLVCLEACKQIQPKNKALEDMIDAAKKETKKHEKVMRYAERFKKLIQEKKLDVFKAEVSRLQDEYRQHPLIAYIYNTTFIRTESSGKDVAYFCGYTSHVWNPDVLVKEGVGGSEEAVIHLTKRLAKKGWNITVYNNCGEEKSYDGVLYKPWYLFNYRDKYDVAIVWRHPRTVDSGINATRIFVDMHDVMKAGEFTESRLKKIDGVFLKSEAHRRCFPSIPDEKVILVPNGIVPEDFNLKVERDPYLLINTSSPDRSLSAICRIFPRIKAKEPRARMKWAYGFGVYDATHATNPKMMSWKEDILKQMEDAGIENLGKLSHSEIAKLTCSAGIYFYPTHFYEIDCISVRKAQLGGCIPVTSDFAALETTNKTGIIVNSRFNDANWCPPYAFEFGDTKDSDDAYVNAVLAAFNIDEDARQRSVEWAKDFSWDNITEQWNTILCEQ